MTPTAAALLSWLMSLPALHDGNGADIPRHDRVATVIANVAAQTDRPQFWASILDVWAAYESGYGDATAAGGCPGVPIGVLCPRSHGARYCGPWMTECRRVPLAATLGDQARIAITMMRESFVACPDFPFAQYDGFVSRGGVDCRFHALDAFRRDAVRREMAIALEGEP